MRLTAPAMSLETAKRVLRIEAEAIADLIDRLDGRFEQAVELLFGCKGRVAVTGMGKSGLIGRKIAATFCSTGTPAYFLHASEALHGDLGVLTAGDVLLAISSSESFFSTLSVRAFSLTYAGYATNVCSHVIRTDRPQTAPAA